MNMLLHNLKVAVRNLMKYKLQTTISVLSIAIGIVTLAFAHAALTRVKFPSIYHQPYYERTYAVHLELADGDKAGADSAANDQTSQRFARDILQNQSRDILRALKRDGGPKSVERMAVSNGVSYNAIMTFHLCDSTERKSSLEFVLIDPDYMNLHGLHSAITGQKIKKLNSGEAVMSKQMATVVFGDANPIGAVCYEVGPFAPVPLTIVDVFEDVSAYEHLSNRYLYCSLGEIEGDLCGMDLADIYYFSFVDVVRREGYTERQLQAELNARLKPFGLSSILKRRADDHDIRNAVMTYSLVHLVGALILIAAIIGFLRMQVQLFWMRRREVSLRITNGAKRRHLFALLFTEVLLVVVASVVVAMLMGNWVESFLNTRFMSLLLDGEMFSIQGLARYSLYTGALLLLVCGWTIWVALTQICKADHGLAANMRNSRTHLFRNIMLSIQITISTIFVCGTLTVANWANLMLKPFHLPDNLDTYKNAVLLRTDECMGDLQPLLNEIERLPDLKKLIRHDKVYLGIRDIQDNPEAFEAFQHMGHRQFYCTTDTSLIPFYHLQVNWFKTPVNVNECLILDEELYQDLRDAGLASDDRLTLRRGNPLTLPIAGTISRIPYENAPASILIHPSMEHEVSTFVLIPKDGRYRSLMREVDATVRRMEPAVVKKMAQNFHESNAEVIFIESFRIVGWILGAISIIICSMSIYSTVSLDSRSRRKEVAIRKVNGAKSRDIYRLFGRVYFLLIVLSLVIAIPVAVLFNRMIFSTSMSGQAWEGADISPLIPCVGGALIVIALIAAIVYWNIRSIMRTNPSEIIAKE